MLGDESLSCETVLANLPSSTTIEEINWDITAVSEQQATLLAAHLQQHSHSLRSFTFTCENMTPQARLILLQGIAQAKALQQLVLYESLNESAFYDIIILLLSNNPNMMHLYLATDVPKQTTGIVERIFNLTALKHLTLIGFDLSNAQFENLSQLQTLNLQKGQLGDSLQQLATLASITILQIANIILSEQQIKYISQCLSASPVTELALPNTQLDNVKMSIILIGLMNNPLIKHLNFQLNKLTPDILNKFTTLRTNGFLKQLQNLNLLNNKISTLDPLLTALQMSLTSSSITHVKKSVNSCLVL